MPSREQGLDPAVAQAREHLDAGDFDAARAAYQAILGDDPDHPEAKGAVRQIVFLERATGHPPTAVAAADAAPDDIEAAFAAADVEILQQNVAGAFDRLIALVRRTAGDERTAVRTRLIEFSTCSTPPTRRSSPAGATSPTRCTDRAPRRRDRRNGGFYSYFCARLLCSGGGGGDGSGDGLEPQRRQRRQHHHCRGRAAVPRLVGGLHRAEVADARSVVDRRRRC